MAKIVVGLPLNSFSKQDKKKKHTKKTLTSIHVHPYCLDESISTFTGLWQMLSFLLHSA